MRAFFVSTAILVPSLAAACSETSTPMSPPVAGGGTTQAGAGGSDSAAGAPPTSGGTSMAGSMAAGNDAGGSAAAGSNTGGATPMGGTGGMAGTTGTGGAAGATYVPSEEVAMLLSETGLYSDITTETLAPGVQWFQPRFPLWSDGSDKNRWLWLPPGTQIDTTDMDNWEFPVGTKIWKEFVRDGVRVETRLIERFGTGGRRWKMLAYIWNADGTDAVASPLGEMNSKGTDHDVPNEETCKECHDNRADKPIGVSAVQLAHDLEGMNLASMIADGLLSAPPTEPLVVPGSDVEQAAIGYLHGNCGSCHRDASAANSRVDVRMWLEVGSLGSVQETDAYTQLVNQHALSADSSCATHLRIFGGDPDRSEVIRRMSQEHRGMMPMPPVGSELEDADALQLLSAWIATLPAGDEAMLDPCCANADDVCCADNPGSPSCN